MNTPGRLKLAGLTLAGGLGAIAPAWAQTEAPTEVDAVVVTAERAQVPIWRLSRGAGTVVLVGAIDRLPNATPWRPAALEAAVAQADAVILEPEARGSVLDVGRILLQARSIIFLPKGETVASRYGADLDRRLAALAAAGRLDKNYVRLRAPILSSELLSAAEGPHGRKRAPGVAAVAERAAKRAKTPRRPVIRAPVQTLLDDLKTDSPEDLLCLQAAADAAEAGPAAALNRGKAYVERRIPDVLASSLQRAEDICVFNRAGPVGDAVRAAYRNTVEVELGKPGVVVAVASLEVAAGPNGILDTLLAQGVKIEGPRWRADQPAGQAF